MKNIFTCLLLFTAFFLNAQVVTLWGTTSVGGANSKGVIFKINSDGTGFSVIHHFSGADGSNPYGSLMKASNGKIYGLTKTGGANSGGVLFEVDPGTLVYTKRVDFGNSTYNASDFSGHLIQGSNGKLFAMSTSNFNSPSYSVIFTYNTTTNTYQQRYALSNAANGSNSAGSLIEASNNMFYGFTYVGGTNNDGVVFEYYDSFSSYTKKVNLTSSIDGSGPRGAFIKASDGNLYAMAMGGGSSSRGTIFQYNISLGSVAKMQDFNTTKGCYPEGSLLEANNGKLYGLTKGCGTNNDGTLFEYDYASNIFTKKHDFLMANGSKPYGDLMQASNGKLYGTTREGGSTNIHGTIFEFDIATGTHTKIFDFLGTNGTYPMTSHLLEVANASGINETVLQVNATIYPNPTDNGIVHIICEDPLISVSLKDNLGREIFRSENSTTIETKDLNSGIYFVEITTAKGRATKKLILN